MPRRQAIAGVLALLLTIGLIAVALVYRDDLAAVASIGRYSLVGVFALSFISASAVSVTAIPVPYYLPVFVLSHTLSAEWGLLAPLAVGATSAAANTVGELPTFMVGYGGRRLSERLASRISEGARQRAMGWARRFGSLAVFLVSAIPNPMHLPLTMALGALQYPPLKWAVLTLLGNLFKNFMFAFVGYYSLNLVP